MAADILYIGVKDNGAHLHLSLENVIIKKYEQKDKGLKIKKNLI